MQVLAVVPSPEYCKEASETEAVQTLLQDNAEKGEYIIEPLDNPTYFPGMCASLKIKKKGESKFKQIGEFGALHPDVIQNFKLALPISCFEMNLQAFM
jgi:phenylalanyl-tRNA synthetase beta chain